MQREQLEHIIRAAADITKQTEFIIIGSQAILGQYPNAPAELLISMEADLYSPARPELSDFIDGAIGRDTRFDDTHGYHADGVSPTTATLPAGWGDRLTPIRNANTNSATGWCIEAHDIAIAKYAAGREKDLRYNADLWEAGLLDPDTLDERLRNTELKPTDKPREWIEGTIRRHRPLHDTGRRPRPVAPVASRRAANPIAEHHRGQAHTDETWPRAHRLMPRRYRGRTRSPSPLKQAPTAACVAIGLSIPFAWEGSPIEIEEADTIVLLLMLAVTLGMIA